MAKQAKPSPKGLKAPSNPKPPAAKPAAAPAKVNGKAKGRAK
jgi:hypothetical protein